MADYFYEPPWRQVNETKIDDMAQVTLQASDRAESKAVISWVSAGSVKPQHHNIQGKVFILFKLERQAQVKWPNTWSSQEKKNCFKA